MTPDSTRVGGAIVFWTLSEWTGLIKLNERLTELGFGECTPERRPAPAALKSSLEEVLGTKNTLIRPLKDRDGFTVVRERRGETENDYTHELSAKLLYREDKSVDRIEFHGYHASNRVVTEVFNRHLGLLPANAVADCLVKIVARLQGTALRPRGGVYWIPNSQVSVWREVGQAVELCAEHKAHKLYTMRQLMDADAARAIRDSIEQELLTEARRIHEEVMSGELGERALESRRVLVEDLAEKAREYETIIGQSLSHLREALDKSLIAEAAGALLSAAGATGD